MAVCFTSNCKGVFFCPFYAHSNPKLLKIQQCANLPAHWLTARWASLWCLCTYQFSSVGWARLVPGHIMAISCRLRRACVLECVSTECTPPEHHPLDMKSRQLDSQVAEVTWTWSLWWLWCSITMWLWGVFISRNLFNLILGTSYELPSLISLCKSHSECKSPQSSDFFLSICPTVLFSVSQTDISSANFSCCYDMIYW